MITIEQAQEAIAKAEAMDKASTSFANSSYYNAVICTLAWVISGAEDDHPLKGA